MRFWVGIERNVPPESLLAISKMDSLDGQSTSRAA